MAKQMGYAPNEEKIKAHIPHAQTCFAAMDAIIRDQPYMAGSDFSLADIMAGPQVAAVAWAPEGQILLANYPRLRGWLDTLNKRDSFRKTVASFG